ncbi:glycosyltransferase family 61 protein [Methylobacterium sp. M6A4_1b]
MATRPSAILVLCDDLDPGLEAFAGRFIHAPICLATGNPNLARAAPAGVTVACGDLEDRRWLRALAVAQGPSLIVDQRAGSDRALAWAFAVLFPVLAEGGVYAIQGQGGPWDRLRIWNRSARALDRRLAAAGGSARRRDGDRIAGKPEAMPRPIRLRPAAEIPAPPAVAIEAPNYRRATAVLVGAAPGIADFAAQFSGSEAVPPEARVYRFREAIVFGIALVQVGDALVAESLINRDRGGYLGALSLDADGTGSVHHTLPRPRRVTGRTVHLWQLWAENYGHWLIECLPRLHVAARAGLLDGARVTVQAIPSMEALYRESLSALGIGADRIVWLTQREVVFEELVYPTPVTVQPITKSPLVIEAARDLRERIGPPPEPLPDRIYVSRNRNARRRLVNEAEVVALLAERGYRTVHPEAESFARQVQIFAAARLVIGGMGAALSNLAFSEPGVRCLMLTNRDMPDDFFLDLAGLVGGSYVSIHGDSVAPELGMQSDYTIPVEILRETLDRHGF